MENNSVDPIIVDLAGLSEFYKKLAPFISPNLKPLRDASGVSPDDSAAKSNKEWYDFMLKFVGATSYHGPFPLWDAELAEDSYHIGTARAVDVRFSTSSFFITFVVSLGGGFLLEEIELKSTGVTQMSNRFYTNA